MNHVTEKKLNNKGFSLVELIIVIAIMAVLIGVLAPQYLKYVEKSRESADIDAISTMVSAVEIYNTDPDHTPVTGNITCGTTGAVTVPTPGASGAAQTIGNALADAGVKTTGITMRSDKYKDWTITFAADEVTFSGTNGSKVQAGLGR